MTLKLGLRILIGCFLVILYGCAEKSQQPQSQPLIFVMKAQPGQAISGLESLKVFSPNAAQQQRSDWADVAVNFLSVLGPSSKILAGGYAARALLRASRNNIPGPVIVEQPPPISVEQPPPFLVTQPDPIVITQPAPISISQPTPIIMSQPEPIIVRTK